MYIIIIKIIGRLWHDVSLANVKYITRKSWPWVDQSSNCSSVPSELIKGNAHQVVDDQGSWAVNMTFDFEQIFIPDTLVIVIVADIVLG